MGNSLGGKRKSAKVMQLDGSSFRVKPPAAASDVLRDHPGFQLLESEEVKLLGARARPLAPDAPLRRGRLYFLVALPRRAPAGGHMRRAWSGNLRVGARERLESLMLARRSTSDLSSLTPAHASATAPTSPLPNGAASPLPAGAAGTPVRLKMRLPRRRWRCSWARARTPPRPPPPDEFDLSEHYPRYFPADKGSGEEEAPPPRIRFADVGCGFGGLLVGLSPLFPDTLMIGMELRDKVTEYVNIRIQGKLSMPSSGGSPYKKNKFLQTSNRATTKSILCRPTSF